MIKQMSPVAREGFTLLELVIGMAIVAILAMGLWGNFFTSILKGKDARRKQDLDSISHAFELYYADNRAYPTPVVPAPSFNLWGTAFVNSNDASVIYMQKVPQDPTSPEDTYCYTSDGTGSFYRLYTNLENAQDPKLLPTPGVCDGVNYNYGISSSNTVP